MTTAIEHELESLLRREIATAETYTQVLNRVDDPEVPPLREIQNDHGEAIDFFYHQLTSLGCEPHKSSGVMGFFAKAFEGTALLLGKKSALSALRERERTGLSQYQRALQYADMTTECRDYVAHRLVPAQRRHIDVLTRSIDAM